VWWSKSRSLTTFTHTLAYHSHANFSLSQVYISKSPPTSESFHQLANLTSNCHTPTTPPYTNLQQTSRRLDLLTRRWSKRPGLFKMALGYVISFRTMRNSDSLTQKNRATRESLLGSISRTRTRTHRSRTSLLAAAPKHRAPLALCPPARPTLLELEERICEMISEADDEADDEFCGDFCKAAISLPYGLRYSCRDGERWRGPAVGGCSAGNHPASSCLQEHRGRTCGQVQILRIHLFQGMVDPRQLQRRRRRSFR
jgi:hypothetical protein